jgi:hypothetical protein
MDKGTSTPCGIARQTRGRKHAVTVRQNGVSQPDKIVVGVNVVSPQVLCTVQSQMEARHASTNQVRISTPPA